MKVFKSGTQPGEHRVQVWFQDRLLTSSALPLPFALFQLRQLASACLLLFSDAQHPCRALSIPGTHLFCISSLIFIMKWPLLALKYQNNLYRICHQMTYAMYLSILIVTKSYRLSNKDNRNVSFAFWEPDISDQTLCQGTKKDCCPGMWTATIM